MRIRHALALNQKIINKVSNGPWCPSPCNALCLKLTVTNCGGLSAALPFTFGIFLPEFTESSPKFNATNAWPLQGLDFAPQQRDGGAA